MIGKINLNNMRFYAYHGCFESEKIVGNFFRVDAVLYTNCIKPAVSDDINDALNYQLAYNIIKEQMDIPSSLIEHVGKRILDALFERFPRQLIEAQIEVHKLNPPIGGDMQSVSIVLSRKSENL